MPATPQYISKWRTKTPDKVWGDRGPDLLRTKTNAGARLAEAIGDRRNLYVKLGRLKPWKRIGSKARVLEMFTRWDGRDFIVGQVHDNKPLAFYQVRRERILFKALSNCSPKTSLNWSLASFTFPNARFGGGYVWKQVSGSSSWSDHAWGTAFDISGYEQNDDITSWFSRMAQEGQMDFDYVLGSRDNETKVVQVNSRGEVSRSSASDSHLWHNHQSVVDHDGRKPPREGGVW